VCGEDYAPSRKDQTRHGACRYNFEPQAAPEEEWAGRPFDDARNNFRVPPQRYEGARDLSAAPIRVAVVDVETTALDASFGRVLCAVAQFFAPDEMLVWRADTYPEWQAGKRFSDKDLVSDILLGIEDADIVVAHNGTNYDLPFLRTRAMIHGLAPVHPKKIYDPVLLARRQFRFHSNRLDSINKVLKTSTQKTDLDPETWAKAYGDGDPTAMESIVQHCVQDVLSLCEASRIMAPYISQLDRFGSAFR
jgi:uncharacterized protein YprB with RNaseH-like and TPR domain